jgi:hypothetical protein
MCGFRDGHGTRLVPDAVGIDQLDRNDDLGIVGGRRGKHTQHPCRGQSGRDRALEIRHDVLPLALISR